MIKLYICLFWQKHPTEQLFYDAQNRTYMHGLSALALTASALLVPVLGMTPNLTMDAIADFAGGFLHAASPEHAVHYFSLTNLKGAGISLAIGLIVYLAFIRPVLTREEDGVRVYVDAWPAGLDVEERIYRPLIGGLLRLGGAAAQIGNEEKLENRVYWPALRALSFISAVISKALGDVFDEIALLFTRTVLAMRRNIDKIRVGNVLTDAAGGLADSLAELLNRTLLRNQPVEHHYTGTFAGLWDGVMHAVRRVTHTMSYGLLLFGLGLCVTLIYLLMY